MAKALDKPRFLGFKRDPVLALERRAKEYAKDPNDREKALALTALFDFFEALNPNTEVSSRLKEIERKARRQAETESNPKSLPHVQLVEWFTRRKSKSSVKSLPSLEPGDTVAQLGELAAVIYTAKDKDKIRVYVHGHRNNFLEDNDMLINTVQKIVDQKGKAPAGVPLYLLADKKTFMFQVDKFSPRGMIG